MAHGKNASEKGNKKGYDYSGRRIGNKSQCNSPTKHKSKKKITHRLERQRKKRTLYNTSARTIHFFMAYLYSEKCSACGKYFKYTKVYGNRHLTREDLKPIICPYCDGKVFPCDYCRDYHYSPKDCNKCELKEVSYESIKEL